MRSAGYVLLCLMVPLVWGVVSAHVFDRYAAWRQKRLPPDAISPSSSQNPDDREMYYI